MEPLVDTRVGLSYFSSFSFCSSCLFQDTQERQQLARQLALDTNPNLVTKAGEIPVSLFVLNGGQ